MRVCACVVVCFCFNVSMRACVFSNNVGGRLPRLSSVSSAGLLWERQTADRGNEDALNCCGVTLKKSQNSLISRCDARDATLSITKCARKVIRKAESCCCEPSITKCIVQVSLLLVCHTLNFSFLAVFILLQSLWVAFYFTLFNHYQQVFSSNIQSNYPIYLFFILHLSALQQISRVLVLVQILIRGWWSGTQARWRLFLGEISAINWSSEAAEMHHNISCTPLMEGNC